MRRLLICFLVVATAVMTSVAISAPAAFAVAEGGTWSNRAAPQSDWRAVAYGGGVYVAVADGGADRVMTSGDGTNWVPKTAAEPNSWTSVTYGASKFVAVSSDGTDRVMTSPDGNTWTARSAPAGAWQSVTFSTESGGIFVAVASDDTNRVMTSPDGITWTPRTAAAALSWTSVTTDNSQFVAVAADGGADRVMTSPDGITWALSGDGDTATGNWTSVAFGGGTYVAVADGNTNRVMTSGNGTTWTPQAAAEANAWTSVTYGNTDGTSRFVAVATSGGNRVMTSGDGTSWAPQAAAAANAWTAVTSNGPDFVAVAASGTRRVMSSTDGLSWTLRTAQVNSWKGVAYGQGVFVAVALDGTINRVMTSTDGITWAARAATEPNAWTSVVYGPADGLFVAVARSGTNRVMTSPDGITWSAESEAQSNQWTSVAYGNGTYVAVADSGTDRVMTSPDGANWTSRSAAENNAWTSVTYGNGRFVAVASDGTNRVMTSPDGITWTPRAASDANSWTSVTTNGTDLFVAVASDGTNRVMTSPDGATWTSRTAGQANQWRGVTFGAATYVSVSSNGTDRVQTSPNGTTWTAQVEPNAQNGQWASVTYSSGLFVAVANEGTARIMTSGTYVPNVPTITSFTPTSGAVGSTVTINGTNLSAPTGVTFNGVAATFAPVSATQMTATVPAGATTGPIVVTTDGGVATSSTDFSVVEGAVRIWGQDELDTSIAISQSEFPADDSASAVVLARNDFFPDALAGGPLAAQENGPLLLTYGAPTAKGGTLPAKVLNEINRVLEADDTVYILGGELAISANVATALESAGYNVVRLWGPNQFATAVAIANEITSPDSILEATGWNFPDALSAVPAAIKINGVILLTNNNKQAPETQAYIDAHPSLTRYTIGGNLVAGGADPGATNISGQNLYDTSAAVADRWFDDPAQFGVATGNNFPDALSGGVFIATGGRMGPMLLVNGTTTPVPPSIDAYLGTLDSGTTGYAFGGIIAITDAVLNAVMAAVG